MKVYVGINTTRDHRDHVVGVASTPAIAQTMVEMVRQEPLRLDEHGCLNNFPVEGPPDWVASVVDFDLDQMPGEGLPSQDPVAAAYAKGQEDMKRRCLEAASTFDVYNVAHSIRADISALPVKSLKEAASE